MLTRPVRVPILACVVTFSCVCVMIGLGMWQLDRMHQKQARLADIEMKQQQSPLNIQALSTMDTDVRDVKVTFAGISNNDHILLLDNRTHNGQPGYHVLSPVESNGGTVLVNWGWIKAPRQREQLPQIVLPMALTEFTGIVSMPSYNPLVKETAQSLVNSPARVQSIDIEFFKRQLNLPFLPFVIQLTAPDSNDFIRNWQPVVMPPEKHLAYAVQWFGLALAAIVIFAVLVIRRNQSHE